MYRAFFAAFATLLACSSPPGPAPGSPASPETLAAQAQASSAGSRPAILGALELGGHAVGFHQILATDPARVYASPYHPGAAAEAPRPILMNIWYPAAGNDGTPLAVADYFQVPRSAAVPAQLSELFGRHTRSIVTYEILDRDAELVPAATEKAIADVLASPVLARRDARPASGPFPLVLGHAGLIAAFNDNFPLWETLASHGYIVVTSSFVSDDPSIPYIDWDPERSIADLRFILRELAQYSARQSGAGGAGSPPVGLEGAIAAAIDPARLAAVGHSYGAQASLAFGMQSRRVDAVVSIDSTIENGPPNAPFYKDTEPQHFLGRVESLTAPTLILASARARVMSFVESLIVAERHFVGVPNIGHNDYIATGGLLRPLVFARLEGTEPDYLAKLEQRRRGYEFVIGTIRRFLDLTLRQRDERRWLETVAERLPGARYRHYPASSPRADRLALTRAVLANGAAAAQALCARSEPCQKERRERFDKVAEALTAARRFDLAEQVYRLNRDQFPESWPALREHALSLARLRRHDEARRELQKAREMIARDPKLAENWRAFERDAIDQYLQWLDELAP